MPQRRNECLRHYRLFRPVMTSDLTFDLTMKTFLAMHVVFMASFVQIASTHSTQ